MAARLTFLRCQCEMPDISSVSQFTETSNGRYKFFLTFHGWTVFLKRCFISCESIPHLWHRMKQNKDLPNRKLTINTFRTYSRTYWRSCHCWQCFILKKILNLCTVHTFSHYHMAPVSICYERWQGLLSIALKTSSRYFLIAPHRLLSKWLNQVIDTLQGKQITKHET